MYLKGDQNNFIVMMSVKSFGNSIEAPNPNADVIKWFATGKYKFVNNEYILQEDWMEPEIDPNEL